LNGNGLAETDLIQVRNIDGLDPVKASINTSPYGAVDGAAFVGSSVLSRNIVLTLHPNPNWDDWTYEGLRRLLYSYFMPKSTIQLVFYSDDMDPVEISGIVEDVQVNMFSKDPELIVSVICPDPYFNSLNPIVITGQAVMPRGATTLIEYNGNIQAGISVKVTSAVSGSVVPYDVDIQIGPWTNSVSHFVATPIINTTTYFEMSSVPTRKFAQNVDLNSSVITNILSKVKTGSVWPVFQPGENEFSVVTNTHNEDWELTYYERYGGL